MCMLIYCLLVLYSNSTIILCTSDAPSFILNSSHILLTKVSYLGNPHGPDAPNKKYYDPRAWTHGFARERSVWPRGVQQP